MNIETKNKIEELLKTNNVIVFVKGNPETGMCGFSSKVIGILDGHKIEYVHFNVLEDPEIWDGIREHGNWPTIPQLYVKEKLIGGCDIVLELDKSGELKEILNGGE